MASFGRWNAEGSEFIVEDCLAPPRHLVNFSWNDSLISGLNQFGSGEGVFNNQTLLFNDPAGRARMIREGRRYFYVRESGGAFWNVGHWPARRSPFSLKTRIGQRYTILEHECEGIRTEALCLAAPDEPAELWRIELRNPGAGTRRLKVYPYAEWLLQGYPIGSDYISYLRSEYLPEISTVIGHNTSDERPHRRYSGFVSCDAPASGWAGSPREFLGVYGDPARPDCVIRGSCPSRPTSNEVLASALEIPVELGPGESRILRFLVGATTDEEAETRRLVGKLLAPGAVEAAFERLLEGNTGLAAHTRIATPEPAIDRLANRWAKTQVQLCAEFGRDGARGFRDALQDAWAISTFNAELARGKILEALRHQFSGGWTLRGWMPVNERRYSEGPTWIAPAVTSYIKVTGRLDILEEVVPFYDAGEGSVLEHLLRGLRHLHEDRGERGLCRAHRGDWNDSLDWMGRGGKGESVMTSMGLYNSLRLTGELALEVLGDRSLAAEMAGRAEEIRRAVEQKAWDGDWYLQGYADSGRRVGSQENRSGKIYLPPQAWAILSGLASPERAARCAESALGLLESDHGCLVSSPAYTEADPDVGRLTVILPGTYENASPYCHGTAFMIAALARLGRADDALRLYRKVLPDGPGHPSEVSGVEPWAFTNQYLGPDNLRSGFAVSGWITGTAGWMYHDLLEEILGVRADYRGLRLAPRLPTAWREASVEIELRGTRYAIEIRRAPEGGAGAAEGASGEPGSAPRLRVDGCPIGGDLVTWSHAERRSVEVLVP